MGKLEDLVESVGRKLEEKVEVVMGRWVGLVRVKFEEEFKVVSDSALEFKEEFEIFRGKPEKKLEVVGVKFKEEFEVTVVALEEEVKMGELEEELEVVGAKFKEGFKSVDVK